MNWLTRVKGEVYYLMEELKDPPSMSGEHTAELLRMAGEMAKMYDKLTEMESWPTCATKSSGK